MQKEQSRIHSLAVCDKTTIWRTYYIKTSENTEQRIIIQMYSIQYPQTDQSHYDIPWFLLSHLHNLITYNITLLAGSSDIRSYCE